jgi:5-methylcytosine-specific restriction enzyme subunit McrC
MQTDVSLCDHSRKIIVEAKYYRETFAEHFGSKKFHSQNLYQILSYLMNADPMNRNLEGILVYPTINHQIKARYQLCGVPVTVCTVNLAQDWKLVHGEVMALLSSQTDDQPKQLSSA